MSSNRLEIRLLGGLAIGLNGKPVENFASRKAQALVAFLACNPQPCPRDVLANLLWSEGNQKQTMGNLRVLLSSLRKLEPHIDISRTLQTRFQHHLFPQSSGTAHALNWTIA